MNAPTAQPRPCLLLVDDTPANIDVLVGILKSDYELRVANRGAKALQICESGERIDLILLDVMMPEMDGYEVCRRLRAMEAMREVPVIFLTAKTAVEDVVAAFEQGANDYLTKPFRPAELRARVRTHLTIGTQRQEIERKNADLREMLHIVCHDVGNQFAVLSMALDIVRHYPEQSLTRFLPRIEAAVRNGIGLTQLVREMRQVEDKPIELQVVPFRAALEESLLLLDDRLQEKQLAVNLDVAEFNLRAERYALTNSVIGNILSNAIKFSPRGGRLHIAAVRAGDRMTVSFRDEGIGMSPEILQHLFDVSRSRTRQGTEGERGTGFGMPLMRSFVLLFGGTVEVTSRPIETNPKDHGTEFRLILPMVG